MDSQINEGDFINNRASSINPNESYNPILNNNQSRLTIATGQGFMVKPALATGGIQSIQSSILDINTNFNIAEPVANNEFEKINKETLEDSSKLSESVKNSKAKVDQDNVCRICLGTEEEGQPDEEGNPDKLICPCKCAGSMGLIHISCLKEWVNSKRLVYKGSKV